MDRKFAPNAALHLQQLNLSEECINKIEEEVDRVSEAPRERSEYYRSERKFLVNCSKRIYTISFQISNNHSGEEMEVVSVNRGDTL